MRETSSVRDTVRNVGKEVEAEVTRLITYLNDEVVPEVRRSSSAGLRLAAEQLSRMAEHLESASKRTDTSPTSSETPPREGSQPHGGSNL